MYNNVEKYTQLQTSGKDNKELMILVLGKAEHYLKEAKSNLENKDHTSLGKNILKVVEIFKGLTKTVTVKDDKSGTEDVFKIYQQMCFLVENLVASRAQPEEYDYFIEFISKLKKSWEELDQKSDSYPEELSSSLDLDKYQDQIHSKVLDAKSDSQSLQNNKFSHDKSNQKNYDDMGNDASNKKFEIII